MFTTEIIEGVIALIVGIVLYYFSVQLPRPIDIIFKIIGIILIVIGVILVIAGFLSYPLGI